MHGWEDANYSLAKLEVQEFITFMTDNVYK